ncbi:anthocyanidin 3-O-galactosyltransferase F3GT1-like [Argentina anserina]|uniref:anthocyanidin 3-O-galactosyltransferase F3GT1-like n=1 Tax=Argentina anserina TaxID=57926 RepID=UPI0021767B49|nr:anthocyanidin 3-O-galactosyltransferase F3GT1-like [Potentilla anserina]
MSHKIAGTGPQHVAVLVFPFTSHPASILRFVRSISTLAPDMQFTFFNISRSNSSLFLGSCNMVFGNIKPYNVWDGLPDGYTPPSSGNPLLEQIKLFLDNALGSFEKAIKEVEAATGHKFNCLISDAPLWFAGDIAEKMHVTWVPFWISGQRSLLLHIETDLIKEKLQGQEDKTLGFLPGFSNEFRASDIQKEIALGDDVESPLGKLLYKMGQKLPQATVVVINSFETIDLKVTEELKKRLQKLLLVGPQHLMRPVQSEYDEEEEKEGGCLQWLDKQKPASVAYISFGSVGALPPMEVGALAEALEEGGFPFLWSFRGNQEHFPRGFIERTNKLSLGKVLPWVKQERILNHSSVGVHVTHCGWNSVLESITGGVPMIGRPSFADQNLHMRSVEIVWKIGVRIEGGVFSKTGAVKALEQALSLEQGKEMRQKIGILKQLAQEAVALKGRSAQDLKALVEIITSSNLDNQVNPV